MDSEIDVTHSVYEPFNIHISGESLDHINISKLTRPAASALSRKEGYFVECVNKRLIFGFLSIWDKEDGAHRDGEFFFNIFTMDSSIVADVDLSNLKKKLQHHCIEDQSKEVTNTISMKIKNTSNRKKESPVDLIIQWKNSGTAKATLSKVSSLLNVMPDLVHDVKFISKIENDSDHYNVYEKGNGTNDLDKLEKRNFESETDMSMNTEEMDRIYIMMKRSIYLNIVYQLLLLLLVFFLIYYLFLWG